MTLWIISHLITCTQQGRCTTVLRCMDKKKKAPTLTQPRERRSCTREGPRQGQKSFDCQLKRAICTQEEKGQPVPAPVNATGCQRRTWLPEPESPLTEGIKAETCGPFRHTAGRRARRRGSVQRSGFSQTDAADRTKCAEYVYSLLQWRCICPLTRGKPLYRHKRSSEAAEAVFLYSAFRARLDGLFLLAMQHVWTSTSVLRVGSAGRSDKLELHSTNHWRCQSTAALLLHWNHFTFVKHFRL